MKRRTRQKTGRNAAPSPAVEWLERRFALTSTFHGDLSHIVQQVDERTEPAIALAATQHAAVPNQPPVIVGVSLGAPNGYTGWVSGTVRASDPNGDGLAFFASVGSAAKGAVTITRSGVFNYTPTAKARHAAAEVDAPASAMTDSVTLKVVDIHRAASTLVVRVPVSPANSVPTQAKIVTTTNVSTGVVTGLVRATDADDDPLTYSLNSVPGKGNVVLNPAGGFAYTPTASARHGASAISANATDRVDQFTVTVTDGHGGSVTAPVTVAVSPANIAPIASVAVSKPDPVSGVVAGRVNATDPDMDTLTYTAVKATKGTVSVGADGTFAYTPSASARASARTSKKPLSDSVVITVSDSHGGANTVTVLVPIAPANSAPVAGKSSVMTNASTGVVTGSVNAVDAEGDPILYVAGTTKTSKGTVAVTAMGEFIYTPTAGARHAAAKIGGPVGDASDLFTVTVTDKYGAAATIPVIVGIAPANAAPVAGRVVFSGPSAANGGDGGGTPGINNGGDSSVGGGSATDLPVNAGGPALVTGIINGRVPATDADNDPLAYSGPSNTAKGSLVVDAVTGSFAYTPSPTARHAAAKIGAPTDATTDSFTLTITDGFGGNAAPPVTVIVIPANTDPIAGVVVLDDPDPSSGEIVGRASATDADGDALTYIGPACTVRGVVVVNPVTGKFIYTPTPAARVDAAAPTSCSITKTDAFTIVVKDGHGGSTNIPVTVNITPVVAVPGTVIRAPIPVSYPGATQYEKRNGVAFAVLKNDGSVVTWGDAVWNSFWGSGTNPVAGLTSGVIQIYSSENAFAALKADGSVVTWGYASGGGDSDAIKSQLVSGVSQVYSTNRAFAVLKNDGSVVAWGDPAYGGDTSAVAARLSSSVNQIYASGHGFAALKLDGSVVAWGDPYFSGDTSAVDASLAGGVTQVFTTNNSFAALKYDGSVVPWGNYYPALYDWSWAAPRLAGGVVYVYAGGSFFDGEDCFAALKADNSVVTWGSPAGGDSNNWFFELSSGVVHVYSNCSAFAALKSDGSVITWGQLYEGGDHTSVWTQLSSDVVSITSTDYAFAALKKDGSVVTWGDAVSGGDSTSVASQLSRDVVQLFSNGHAFAAMKKGGSVVTWGNIAWGGDSSDVASSLADGVQTVYANRLAFAALKTNGSLVTWGGAYQGGDSSVVAKLLRSGVVSMADPFGADYLIPPTT